MNRQDPLHTPWPIAGLSGGRPPRPRWASAVRVNGFWAHRSYSIRVFPQPAKPLICSAAQLVPSEA